MSGVLEYVHFMQLSSNKSKTQGRTRVRGKWPRRGQETVYAFGDSEMLFRNILELFFFGIIKCLGKCSSQQLDLRPACVCSMHLIFSM